MVTAQETYAGMLRDLVAPRLRDLGFRGSGQRYVLPHDRYWAVVGFQKDRYSDAALVRFMINLTEADKVGWEAFRVAEPWLPGHQGSRGRRDRIDSSARSALAARADRR